MPNETGSPGAIALGTQRRGLKRFGVVAVLVALAVVAYGLITRWQADRALQNWTSSAAIPTVAVFAPPPVTGTRVLALPGTLRAYYSAPIFARVPGYLKAWYTDIGAKVTAGQTLAVIDTPDLDQELAQAKDDLASAAAARNLAAITATRWQALVAKDAVSHQDADEKSGDLAAKTALMNAAAANVSRLEALTAFKQITAPFAGVVTARKTDIGDLINAGSSGGTASELFDVSEVDKLRLYVQVPQVYSAEIKPGAVASITLPQYPNQHFPARLLGTSQAISDQSGTLLAELEVDNAAGLLEPGDYAQVSFNLPAASGTGDFRIPDSAVLFRDAGTQVGVVGPDHRVVLKNITIGTDYGQTVEVVAGLAAGDRVIDNPSDSLAAGDQVTAVTEDQSTGTTNAAK